MADSNTQTSVDDVATFSNATAISSTITGVDAFLATHDSRSWAALSAADRRQVNTWQSILESYNTGVVGPGHCSEQTGVTSSAMFVSTANSSTEE